MSGPSGVGEGRAGAMLTVLDRLSLPGSPERPNEDAFGVAGNWAWILDGSIPPGHAPIMGEASDAVWLVRFAGERFAALAPGGRGWAGADRLGHRRGARRLSGSRAERA